MDKDSAERYRAAKKQQQRLISSRRGPDSDEFGPGIKGGSDYDSHHSRGGSLGGKDSIFDEADGLLTKVLCCTLLGGRPRVLRNQMRF